VAATTLEIQRNNITWVVSYKDNWADSWTTDEWLMPEEVSFTLAPDIPTALLVRDFARMHKLSIGGGDTSSVSVVEPLDLSGKYVKVSLSQVQSDNSTKTVDWYGYCPAPVDQYEGEREVAGQDVNTGRTTYNCFGLEWLLKDTKVLQSSVVNDVGVAVVAAPISYNFTARKRQWELQGNRSDAMTEGVYHFSEEDTNEWDGLSVLQHLLYHWSIQTGENLTWTILGSSYLENVKNSWDFEGQNYYQAISNIINPSTGFVWSTTFYEGNPAIDITPAFEDDIKDENDAVIVEGQGFSAVLNISTDPAISRCIVKQLETAVYDRVEVRGAPARVCFTIGMNGLLTDAQLDAGWTGAQQTAYDAADDAGRVLDDYSSVYTRHVLPLDWNRESNKQLVVPAIDTETGQFDPDVAGTLYMKNKVFDRTLPWKELDNDTQFRRPFLIFEDEDQKWHMVERPGKKSDDTDFSPVSLKVLDDRLGIQLETGSKPNHIVALNEFDEDTDTDPEWDYNTALATVSMYLDENTRVNLPVVGGGESGENTRTKVIRMPWCELWYIVPGTLQTYDPDEVHSAALVTQVGGEYTRDDTDKLRRAAYLAREWYGKISQVMELDYGSPFIDDGVIQLGGIIGDLNSGEITEPINTIVSNMTYSLREKSQELKIKTSFIELDIARLLAPGRRTGGGQRRFQPSPMHDELANIPVRSGASGGSGEAPYTGEFAISVTGTNELTIAAGDVVSGYTRTAFAGGTLTPTGTFAIYYIYIKVTWVDPDYIIELVGSATKPTQSAGIYYKQIGTAAVNSSVVSKPVQTHKGELEVSGRYAT
jgi:hypothetical protein